MIGETAPTPEPEAETQSSENGAAHSNGGPATKAPVQKEIGGRDGLEPTRYGDWEKNGRCIDF